MKKYILFLFVFLFFNFSITANAQTVALGTNAADWACLLTPNVGLQYAIAQHWSLEVTAGINAWSWNTSGVREDRMYRERKMRRQYYTLGARWWPWNVYSGWWLAGKLQFQEYDYSSMKILPWLNENESGSAWGAGLAAGYSLQLHRHWNMDFGLGFWGGYKMYTAYSCPWCGRTVDKGAKAFIMPDQAIISVMYIF